MLSHIAGGVNVLVSTGVGFTVTTTLNVVALVHPFALTVYTYVTLTGAAVVLSNASFGLALPLPTKLEMPATAALAHANVAPVVELVGV